ncbi:hypothetical protein EJV47_01320 [Hymenobacter gummosus]|uniref:DUF7151 domain-containing protein n=1 Tax=Hymenobacter gummosus TaxID=1776032 RepID=A0A3S0QKY9_9BACT|nr:hypothetical protein [Hymenobacter gummosus]RTQ53409.1 hypothetical protein EJV47_01320 [Hymenobacter gummosus]
MYAFVPFTTATLRRCALLLGLAGSAGAAQAQIALGLGTTTPHPSAALDVSSTTQGLLIPRLTLAQRTAISSPATGLLVYQTDDATPGLYAYSGSAWVPLGGGSSGSAGPNGLNALVRTTVEAAGANCATGGTRVDTGQDANGNGTLDAAEISNTRYVCTGAAGAKGPAGNAGSTGATGSAGAKGRAGNPAPGLATGGSAGQVLTKVDATDYNTAWRTLTAASAVQLRADKVGGTGEIVAKLDATTPTTIAFNNVLTAPTLGTWDGSTYTVGADGAGAYLIQAALLAPNATQTTSGNTTSRSLGFNLLVEVNGAAYGSTSGNVYYSALINSNNQNTPAGSRVRGELYKVVFLSAGDTFKIRAVCNNTDTGSSTTFTPPAVTTSAASYLAVTKLN